MLDISISLSPTKANFGPLLFSGNLNEGLEIISGIGYRNVDISLLDSEKVDRKWLFARLEELNLKVQTLATGQSYYTDGYSLFDHREINRKRVVERLKGHIDLADELESMVIVGGIMGKLTESGARRERQEDLGKMALQECLKYAAKRKVLLLLEPINRYETNIINTLREGVELIEELGFDNLKLLPDTFHMNIEESLIEKSLSDAGKYVGYIHFADSNRCAPGSGHIDFASIVDMLRTIHYEGAIGLEILPVPDDFSAAKKSMEFMSALCKK